MRALEVQMRRDHPFPLRPRRLLETSSHTNEFSEYKTNKVTMSGQMKLQKDNIYNSIRPKHG